MTSVKQSKANELVIASLLNALTDLQVIAVRLHPEYEEPKHDLDNCEVCQVIGAAKTTLTINKA